MDAVAVEEAVISASLRCAAVTISMSHPGTTTEVATSSAREEVAAESPTATTTTLETQATEVIEVA